MVGTDEVEIPVGTPARGDSGHGASRGLTATLSANRLLVGVTFAVAVVFGAILSLVTGSWWALPIACAVHAVGTVLVAALALQMTTRVEHVAPATAAALEAEGVSDPDRALSELTEELAGEQGAVGAAEVVSTGRNDNLADADAEPARAAVEQRTVMTPAHGSRPAGEGSAIGAMPLAVVGGMVAIALIVAIAEGGWAWAAPAITWAAAAIWLALTLRVDGAAEQRAARAGKPLTAGGPSRAPGDAGTAARGRLAPVVAVVTAGVIGFCVFVALLTTSI